MLNIKRRLLFLSLFRKATFQETGVVGSQWHLSICAALICACALVLAVFIAAPTQAHAASIQEGIPDLAVASSSSGDDTSVIAFAGYEWWVIGYNGTGVQSTGSSVTLLSKNNNFGRYLFRRGSSSSFTDSTQYSENNRYYANNPDGSIWAKPNEYAGSTLQQKMDTIAGSFSVAEQSLILAKDLSDANVTAQEVWPLSSNEFDAIGNKNVQQYPDWFWLRSPYPNIGYAVLLNGPQELLWGLGPVDTASYYVRPALSLDLSSVIFTSAADASAEKDFSALESYDVAAWKFTAATSESFNVSKVDGETELELGYTGANLTITHDALSSFTNGYTNVTAVLTNQAGDILYYGSLNNDTNATETQITIPKRLAAGSYTLKLYGEQWNGVNMTNFATGTPYEITITVTEKQTPTPAPDTVSGSNTTSASAVSTLAVTGDTAAPLAGAALALAAAALVCAAITVRRRLGAAWS